MIAQNLASETSENWIYIMGDYLDPNNGQVQDVTDKLIQSYENITFEQVNEAFT